MNVINEILSQLKDHKKRISHLERLEFAVAALFDRAIVINESGADVDFRVEGFGQENALFVQGSDGFVGLGTGIPLAGLHHNGSFILGTDGASIDEVTIINGVITVTKAFHLVDTQNNDATDDLNTINGGLLGQILFLKTVDSARDVVIKHGGGNIFCLGAADITLGSITHLVMLVRHVGSNWACFPLYKG